MSNPFVTKTALPLKRCHRRSLLICQWTAQIASFVVVIVGVLIWIGWVFNIVSLKTFYPSWPKMVPSTGIGFISGGLSLGFLRAPGKSGFKFALGRGCALLMAGLGALTLSEYLFGWKLGVDQLALPMPSELGDFFPGHPALNTSLDFVVLGLALIMLDLETRKGVRPAEWLALVVGLISLVVFTGYAFAIISLYSFPIPIPNAGEMGVNRLSIFALLSVGILCSRPDRGMMKVVISDTLGGVVARRIFLAALIGPVAIAELAIIGIRLGLYERQLGSAIITVLTVTVFSALAWRTARLLDRVDQERITLLISEKEARRQADMTARAREEVMAIVSHDLKNPLTTILIAAESIRHTPQLDGTLQRLVRNIIASAQRMERLIRDLLYVHKIESGVYSVAEGRGPQDLAPIVQEVIESQRMLAEYKAIHLKAEIPEVLPRVSVNRERIIQVFQNLIGNAIKFTPSGGSITVRADLAEDAVKCSVCDTGSGIPQELVPYVFDRFFQTKPAIGLAVGLGLTIAKGIIEAHGGRIWVESKVAAGSTFFFTVPLARHAGQPVRSPL